MNKLIDTASYLETIYKISAVLLGKKNPTCGSWSFNSMSVKISIESLYSKYANYTGYLMGEYLICNMFSEELHNL